MSQEADDTRPEGGPGPRDAGPEAAPPTAAPPPTTDRIRAGHEAVREANRRELVEDYVEAIDDLNRSAGEARVRDLAAGFGISHVAVCSVVERLRRDGLVSSGQQQAIELTEEGRLIAARSRARHAAVLEFLLALGLPPEVAEADAEGMEHHVGAETLAAFARHVARHPEGRHNVFRATVRREDLVARRLRDTADDLCDGSLTPLITQLVSAGKLSREELRELRRVVDRASRRSGS